MNICRCRASSTSAFAAGKWALAYMEQQWAENLWTAEGRRAFLRAWQLRKQDTIQHPFLGEKIPWGLVPYVQALLLARTLRGDLDNYPPFFWK